MATGRRPWNLRRGDEVLGDIIAKSLTARIADPGRSNRSCNMTLAISTRQPRQLACQRVDGGHNLTGSLSCREELKRRGQEQNPSGTPQTGQRTHSIAGMYAPFSDNNLGQWCQKSGHVKRLVSKGRMSTLAAHRRMNKSRASNGASNRVGPI